MGANSPNPHFHSPDPKKKNHFPFIIAAAAILIVCALKWRDVVEYVNGEAQLTAKYRKELQNKLDEADEAEQ